MCVRIKTSRRQTMKKGMMTCGSIKCGKTMNNHEVLLRIDGVDKVVASGLSWLDARDISTSLNALGFWSGYTSNCNIF